MVVYCRPHVVDRRIRTYKGARLVHLPTIRNKYLDTLAHTLLSAIHSARREKPDVALFFIAGNAPLCLVTRLAGIPSVINVDGLPSRRSWTDVSEHDRTLLLAGELESWLDHRRRAADAIRKPGTIDELARRRQRMNPRLDLDWLRYLVTIGAFESDDGWRWKIDPSMRMGGFGPWRPEWSMMRLPGLGMPVLGILGLDVEVMGWGTLPEDIVPNLPDGARFVPLEGVGHFVHIEQPELVAELVLDFLP